MNKAKKFEDINFLQVFLAERIKTKTICAIKVVEKEVVISKYVPVKSFLGETELIVNAGDH